MSDTQIRRGIASDPDVRHTDEEFWKDAKVVWPARKTVVTMRLDADLLAWFRQQRGYQTRINAILRAYMKAHAYRGARRTYLVKLRTDSSIYRASSAPESQPPSGCDSQSLMRSIRIVGEIHQAIAIIDLDVQQV